MASSAMTIRISRSEAYKAAKGRTRQSLSKLCDFWREGQAASPLDERGNTVLHFLAVYGNAVAFRRLVRDGLLVADQLKLCNGNGDTPLHEAARFGGKEVAEVLVEQDRDLILAQNESGETPIYVAAANGKRHVFDFLREKVPRESIMLRRGDGSTVLHATVMGEFYDFGVSLVESYPELVDKRDQKGMTALNLLASKQTSFKSGTRFTLRNLGPAPFIFGQIAAILEYKFIPSTTSASKRDRDVEDPESKCWSWVSKLVSGFRRIMLTVFPWLREVNVVKQKHMFALALAEALIGDEHKTWWTQYNWANLPDSSAVVIHLGKTRLRKENKAPDPLIDAIKKGIFELVMIVVKKVPESVNTFDENGKNILHMAVELKDIRLYEYLKKNVDHMERMLTDVDCFGNTILHLAASVGNVPRFIYGPFATMSWDVFWFQHVKYDSLPHLLSHRNSEEMTAEELFEQNHIMLREKGEKEVKEMNNGLMLISILISTINFAAIFTIPGGFNENSGQPVFFTREHSKKYKELDFFMSYIGLSLVASLLALGSQLSIQLSLFHNNDFYIALPLKYFIAITALFYSTTLSISTCFQAYILEQPSIANRFTAFIFLTSVPSFLVYIDAMYMTFNYMSFVIGFALTYKP